MRLRIAVTVTDCDLVAMAGSDTDRGDRRNGDIGGGDWLAAAMVTDGMATSVVVTGGMATVMTGRR